MKAIRILIVDDHTLVRAGIRALLESIDDVEVVAEAGDGREAIEMIRTHGPNMVLMDIGMAGLNGLEATTCIVREFPMVRVLMLSMHANEEYVVRALRVGASGYLLKGSNKLELEFAVHAVASGKTYLTPEVSKHVVERFMQNTEPEIDPLDQLTPRQREILQLVGEGRTSKDIARILNISLKTVDSHRTQLMERLDIHDIAGLVRYAVKMGLVRL